MSTTPERHPFLQGGNAAGDSSLVLSTDAKPRLKWTPDIIPFKESSSVAMAGDTMSCSAGTCGSNLDIGPQTNNNLHIDDAIQMQIEVQRRLHEQLQVQRHLQLRIEAQGKYLQTVVEKAQDTLGRQNLGTVGLEAAKVQLSELATNVSTTKCLNSAFPYPQNKQASQPTDCLPQSCMPSYEIFQQHQENQDRWSRDLEKNRNFMSPIVQSADRAYEIELRASDLSTRVGIQGGNCRHVEEKLNNGDANADLLYPRTDSVNQENERRQGYQISHSSPRLDLNIHDHSDATSNCKQFDLNGLSWS